MNEESRTKRVRGPAPRTGEVLRVGELCERGEMEIEVEAEGGFIERIILKGEEEDWKAFKEASRVGRREWVCEVREAISDIL